jgi:virginiamycin A acetyltransferase
MPLKGNMVCGEFLEEETYGFTTVGYGTVIHQPSYMRSCSGGHITIGKYCAIAYGVRVITTNHYYGYINMQDHFRRRYKFPDKQASKGDVVIGNGVWIGDEVTILGNLTVGNGAVIGARAVVVKDIPPYCVAVGNPARVIHKRFSDKVISQLVEINWWDWDGDKIKRNHRFFSTDFSQEKDADIHSMIVD